MLYDLRQNLCKWGIFKFEHLDQFLDRKGTCKVCDTCYLLIVSEHELMEIEKLYALALSIPIDDESRKN